MLKNYNRNVEINFLYKKFNIEDFYYNHHKYITADLVFKEKEFQTITLSYNEMLPYGPFLNQNTIYYLKLNLAHITNTFNHSILSF